MRSPGERIALGRARMRRTAASGLALVVTSLTPSIAAAQNAPPQSTSPQDTAPETTPPADAPSQNTPSNNVPQSSPPSAPSAVEDTSSAGSQDVVVTARRTRERLQDVPVSVTAFNNQTLTQQRIQTEADLQIATPGLTVRQTASNNQLNYALRGQSIDAFSSTPPAVVTYFNEVQVGGTGTSSFFDLDSIQVLKGPQGTLFGRNATGGAVLYQARAPSHDFNGYVTAGYGNYNNVEINGAVNVPLGKWAAVRVGASYRRRDGTQYNRQLQQDINQIKYQVYRVGLLLDPIDGLQNVTTFQYGRDTGRGSGLKLSRVTPIGATGPDGTPLLAVTAAIYGEAAFDQLNTIRALPFYDVLNSENNEHRGTRYFVSNKTNYELSDNVSLKNIFGYNRVFTNDKIDVDGSGLPWILVGEQNVPNPQGYDWLTKQWSNETQFLGKAAGRKLSYILGVYISRSNVNNARSICAFCDTLHLISRSDAWITDRQTALYAQGTYKLTPKLSFTAGYRQTWEKLGIDPRPLNTLGEGPARLKVSKPSWTLSLDYKVTPELLVYFAQRGSFRAGGFNPDSAQPNADGVIVANSFKSETTHDFEVGAKYAGRLGGMRSSINLAIYDQIVNDVQRAVYLGIASPTGNVNKARIRGAELDTDFALTSWFELGGGLSYTDAVYSDPRATVDNQTFRFGPYGDAPKWAGTLRAKATKMLGPQRGSLFLSGEVYAQSHFYYTNLAASLTPDTRIAGYAIGNVRLGWDKIQGSRFSAFAYVQNVTNKRYEVGGLDLSATIGTSARLPGTPRTFGIQGTVGF